MVQSAETSVVKIVGSIDEIDAAAWDACANPASSGASCGIPDNPFLFHAFLSALERSGSAAPQTGWAPYHLVLEGPAQADRPDTPEVRGVVPMYLKGHSQGEYVFDYGWADAYTRAGGHYYPKLQIGVPFTPATGRRLLARPGPDQGDLENLLLKGCVEVTNRLDVSSLHITFPTREEWERMGQFGLLQRTDRQFHWTNGGYGSFADFLGELASRKRKQLRRERREALAPGIEIEWVTGSDLTEAHWDAFYTFYMDTGARKWGRPYLTRSFFSMVGETMPEKTLLILCRRGGRYIAGALNFIGSDTLFGRYWGCIEDHRFLHFEACYYQAIDFAITHGLQRVEAGAQGPHKLLRGYMPHLTYSAHYIPDAGFRRAVADFLKRERNYVDEDLELLEEHTPFKKARTNDQGG